MGQPGTICRVLNVGGSDKSIPLPKCFTGWMQDLLDIDPGVKPDVLCDARELIKLPPRVYDAIYCSHNLEHFYHHELSRVLAGFRIVLKKDGFVYIRVPDLHAVMKAVIDQGLDIDDQLYLSPSGPILVRDVFYGYGKVMEHNGNDFFAHKTGFTEKSLIKALRENGFPHVFSDTMNYEVMALGFPTPPNECQIKMLGLKL